MPDLRELLRQPMGTAQEHRLQILRAIMARSTNQRDLARRCGLSEATVSTVVTELEKRGIVRKGPPVIMMPTTGVAVGIELGYHYMAAVGRRVDQSYEEAVVQVDAVGCSDGLDRWLTAASSLIQGIVTSVGDGAPELASVGLAVPRAVDPRTQRLTPPLLPPWENVSDPAKHLTEHLLPRASESNNQLARQLQVRVDNDANLGALAESTYVHSTKETLLYIKASTGVGAGIVIGGRLFRGRRGVAGEIGHTIFNRGGRFCLCGGRGCLETVIGANTLLEQARRALGERTPESLDDLIKRARAGNAVCRRVLREAAYSLGFAMGDLCNTFNPDVVVLGGGLGRGADLLINSCRTGISQVAMVAAHDADYFDLVPSTVTHASAHGALLLGLQGTTYEF